MPTSVVRPTADDAHADWARRVAAEREQVERLREDPPRSDHYAPVAAQFRADPRRSGDTSLDAILALVEPGSSWLDIGAGGGRYTLPIALRARDVTAIEPSPAMRGVLTSGMAEFEISNITLSDLRWPVADPPPVDVAFMSHVSYDIEQIGPFLDAMERAARKRCVVVLLDGQPVVMGMGDIWEAVHGESKDALPALPEFIVLLVARGVLPEVRLISRPPITFPDIESAHASLRVRLWLAEGSEKDRKLGAVLPSALVSTPDGLALPDSGGVVGIVSWTPPGS